MRELDFPRWYGIGSYGGLAVTLLAAAGIAVFALQLRRGTPLQLARSVLVCLAAGSLMLASIWWNQNRLDFYGPSLDATEVTFWLCWTALLGWAVPLATLLGYAALAAPHADPAAAFPARGTDPPALTGLHDPGRAREPLGAGRPWGRLVPLDGAFAGQAMPLTRQVTLLGRELDNDVVVDDDRASRHHAELRWERGRVQMLDYGSMNGTLVNGQAARGPVPLRAGDVIHLGQRSYRLEMSASGALARSATGAPLDEETAKTPGVVAPRPPEAPQFALVGLSGPAAGVTWALDRPVMTLGRDDERDIAIAHPSISRAHAQIVRQQAGYFLADLHSSNGTRLNGEPLVAPALLSAGDVVRVGDVELRCEEAPLAPAVHTTPLADRAAPQPAGATVAFTRDELDRSLRQPSVELPLAADVSLDGEPGAIAEAATPDQTTRP